MKKSSPDPRNDLMVTSVHSRDTRSPQCTPTPAEHKTYMPPQPAGEVSGPTTTPDRQKSSLRHSATGLRPILKHTDDRQVMVSGVREPGHSIHYRASQPMVNANTPFPTGTPERHGHRQRHHPTPSALQQDVQRYEARSSESDRQPSRPRDRTSRERPQLPSFALDSGGEVFLTPDELGQSQRQRVVVLSAGQFAQVQPRGQHNMITRHLPAKRRSSRSSRSSRTLEVGDDFSAVASELTWEDMSTAVRSLRSRDGSQSHSTNNPSLRRDSLGRDSLGRDSLGRDSLDRDSLGRDSSARDGSRSYSTGSRSYSTNNPSLAPPSLQTGRSEIYPPRDAKHINNTIFVTHYGTTITPSMYPTWDVRSAMSHSTQQHSLAPPSLTSGKDDGRSETYPPQDDKHKNNTVFDRDYGTAVTRPLHPTWDVRSSISHSTQQHSLEPPSLKSTGLEEKPDEYMFDSPVLDKDDVSAALHRAGEDFDAVKVARSQLPFFLVLCPIALAVGLGICFGVLTRMSSKQESSPRPLSPTSLPACQKIQTIGLEGLESLETINKHCECFDDASPLPDNFNYHRYERLRAYFQQEVPFDNVPVTSCEPKNRVLLSMNAQHNFTAGNSLDRFLIMLLYLSWDGDSWSGDHGWLTKDTVCSWEGVYCNFEETVDELDLTDVSLRGNIPSLIGKFRGIHTLIISGNQVGGTIPSEIGTLTSLTKLGIYEAGLTGTIPSTIGNLTNLVSLDLYGNSLSGSIPEAMLQLERLQYVDIRGNNMTGDLLFASEHWPSYVDVTGGAFGDSTNEAVSAPPSQNPLPPSVKNRTGS